MTQEIPIPKLAALARSERAQLAALAGAWLAADATYFGIHDLDGEVIACWPDGAARMPDDLLTAEVRILGRNIGLLAVGGVEGSGWLERLEADAKLVTHMFRLTHELDAMTNDLIDKQDQLLAFYRLTQSLHGELHVEGTLYKLAAEAVRLVKADAAFVILHTEGEHVITQHPADFIDEVVLETWLDDMDYWGKELLLNEPENLPQPVEMLLLIPIKIRGAVIAGLCLANKPGGFGSPDIKLARAIAEYAGTQIEKILLYQEMLGQMRLKAELKVAADIQMQLLPHTIPEIEGLQIYAASVQAAQVGGDYYDILQQLGAPLVFMLGDVTGKGIPAALLMVMTRTAMRSRASTVTKFQPGHILAAANYDLYEDYTRVGMFTTVFVGSYTPDTHTLMYANAGQSPVIYRPATGPAQLLQARDMPLGVIEDNDYQDETLALCVGDVFIVATDGFSEAGSKQGEQFGTDRLLALVDACASSDAESIARALFAAIHDFREGNPQDDDQTVIVLKCVK
jgi:phosphoserine phosphatase RsbU/P